MTDYEMDPDVCPSSLNEDGVPATEGETAHKWEGSETECRECGAPRPEVACVCECGNEHTRLVD